MDSQKEKEEKTKKKKQKAKRNFTITETAQKKETLVSVLHFSLSFEIHENSASSSIVLCERCECFFGSQISFFFFFSDTRTRVLIHILYNTFFVTHSSLHILHNTHVFLLQHSTLK